MSGLLTESEGLSGPRTLCSLRSLAQGRASCPQPSLYLTEAAHPSPRLPTELSCSKNEKELEERSWKPVRIWAGDTVTLSAVRCAVVRAGPGGRGRAPALTGSPPSPPEAPLLPAGSKS